MSNYTPLTTANYASEHSYVSPEAVTYQQKPFGAHGTELSNFGGIL